jgi:hypothetical protein
VRRTAQDGATIGRNGRHRVQMKTSSSFITNLTQAIDVMPMAHINFRGILNQQDNQVLTALFSRLLEVGEVFKASSIQQTMRSFLSSIVCGRAMRPKH